MSLIATSIVKRVLPLFMVILLSGCLPSVNPIFTENDVTFDPSLLGIYQEQTNKENYTIIERHSDPKFYKITYKEGFHEYLVLGALIKIDGALFMDVSPLESLPYDIPGGAIGGTDLLRELTWQPTHLFFRIIPETNELKTTIMDFEGFRAALKKDPDALRFLKAGSFSNNDELKAALKNNPNAADSITRGGLIVSSTKDLQAFLRKNWKDPKVFNMNGTLGKRVQRIETSEPPKAPVASEKKPQSTKP